MCEKHSAIKLRFRRLHLFAFQASLVQNFAPQRTFFLYLFEIIVTDTSSKLITKLKYIYLIIKRLRNEDFIWIVYFFIVVFALYSNKLDRDYLLKKDNEAYKREKYINITIFFIAFFIYLYFLLLLTEDLGSMEKNFNDPAYRSTFIQLIAAILFLIGGAIYLINEITRKDDALDVGLI